MNYPYPYNNGYGRPLPSNHAPSSALCTDEAGTVRCPIHWKPAILNTSRTKKNPNRDFVACNERPFSCGFFKWVDDFPNPAALTQVRQQPPKPAPKPKPQPQTIGAAPERRLEEVDDEDDDDEVHWDEDAELKRALALSMMDAQVVHDDSEVEELVLEAGRFEKLGGKKSKGKRIKLEESDSEYEAKPSSSKLHTPPSKAKTQDAHLLAAANKKIDTLQRENKRLRKDNKQLEKDYSRMTDDFMSLNAEKMDWEEEREELRGRLSGR